MSIAFDIAAFDASAFDTPPVLAATLVATLAAASVSGSGHVEGAAMVRTLAPATMAATARSAAGAYLAGVLDDLYLDAADGYVDGQGGLDMPLDLLTLAADCAVLVQAQMAVRLDRVATDTGMPAHPLPAPESHVLRRPNVDRVMRKSQCF